MDIGRLLLVIAQSNAQILLIGITGYVSAHLGIITLPVQRGISELTIKVLMPCLLFAQVAGNVDLEVLARLWPIPTFMCLYALIAGLLGFTGGKFLNLSIPNTKFVTTGIMLNNLASITLALIQSLGSTDVIQILARSPTDKPSEIKARGITYILLATLVGNLLRWSLGAYLLRKQDNNNNDNNVDDDNVDKDEPNEESENYNAPLTTIEIFSDANADFEHLGPMAVNETTPLFPESTRRRSTESRIQEPVSGVLGSSQRFINPFLRIFNSFRKFMNPPLATSLLAIIVGATPPLKSIFFGKHAPLYLNVTKSMITMGDLAVPLTVVCLGAQLKNIPRSKDHQMASAISWVMLCRFMIMPIIGLTLVMTTRSFYLYDPMLWLALMMLAGGPTAINCINLTQLTGAFQEEMATLLFYSYLIAAPVVTGAVVAAFVMISNAVTEANFRGG